MLTKQQTKCRTPKPLNRNRLGLAMSMLTALVLIGCQSETPSEDLDAPGLEAALPDNSNQPQNPFTPSTPDVAPTGPMIGTPTGNPDPNSSDNGAPNSGGEDLPTGENSGGGGTPTGETPNSGGDSGTGGDTPDTGGGSPPTNPTGPIGCDASPAEMQSRMLSLINEARASARQCGSESMAATTPLSWNTTLEATARLHSLDMASVNFFSHTSSGLFDLFELGQQE